MARAARSNSTSQPSPAPAAPATDDPLDPIKGKEIAILTTMLGNPQQPNSLVARAQKGDEGSIDRVVKILDLRRKYMASQLALAAEEEPDD